MPTGEKDVGAATRAAAIRAYDVLVTTFMRDMTE
jgi:hypothetical protein